MTDVFTAREVAALIESLRSEFRTVTEIVLPLRQDMEDVKSRLSGVENRMISLEDVFRVGFRSLDSRISKFEAKIA